MIRIPRAWWLCLCLCLSACNGDDPSVAQAGGLTVAQDEASCVIFGMPKHAIGLGAAQLVLSPGEITACLIETVTGSPKST